MKNIYSIIGAVVLVCFSFYYTESAVNIVKRNDPIMKEIIKVSSEYEVEPVDALLINNNIIPGISGSKLDIDDSYNNMKRLGEFNSSLLEFEEVIPSISVTNNHDKFIINGNKSKSDVYIIFKMNDTSYIEEIIDILKETNTEATFFLDYEIIMNSRDVLKLLNGNSQSIEFLGKNNNYTKADILTIEETLTKINKNNGKFCYTEYENNNVLDICSKSKLHTIIPTINTIKYPFNDVKEKIANGSIIKLDNNSSTVRELKYIINYINQKGYKIKNLSSLLEE